MGVALFCFFGVLGQRTNLLSCSSVLCLTSSVSPAALPGARLCFGGADAKGRESDIGAVY